MKYKVFSVQGEEIRTIELNDDVFNCKISDGAIYYSVKNELANKRVGTACTKTRGEVHGSNIKPYAQKGTGRARAGDFKSPTRVGGGTIFGPKPRDYTYRTPKKVKRLAMKSILSMKAQDGSMRVVEDFSIESGKTKDLLGIMNNLVGKESTVIILKDDDKMIRRAGSNIPWIKFLGYNRLNAHDIFYGKHLLIFETAAKNLNTFYASDAKGKEKI